MIKYYFSNQILITEPSNLQNDRKNKEYFDEMISGAL